MQHNKLSPEQKEDLLDIINHPGIYALLQELDNLVADLQSDIIKLPLETSNEKELFLRKARADGALRLAVGIKQRIQSLKPKKANG